MLIFIGSLMQYHLWINLKIIYIIGLTHTVYEHTQNSKREREKKITGLKGEKSFDRPNKRLIETVI